jgi:hypothetical protein
VDKKLILSRQDINTLQSRFVEEYTNKTYYGMDSKDSHTIIWFNIVEELLSSKGLIKSNTEANKPNSTIS